MPDKQTYKTFEEFIFLNIDKLVDISDIKLAINDPEKFGENMGDFYREIWNAATETTRSEYDDKIKAMQAEIDNRNILLTRIKDDLIWARESFYLPQKVLDNQRTLITKLKKSIKPARGR